MRKILSSWAFVVEPPIGIEPMTYALREVRSLAPHALAAPIARAIALTAMAALELSKDPFHEPFHARGHYVMPSRSGCVAPPAAPHHVPMSMPGRHRGRRANGHCHLCRGC